MVEQADVEAEETARLDWLFPVATSFIRSCVCWSNAFDGNRCRLRRVLDNHGNTALWTIAAPPQVEGGLGLFGMLLENGRPEVRRNDILPITRSLLETQGLDVRKLAEDFGDTPARADLVRIGRALAESEFEDDEHTDPTTVILGFDQPWAGQRSREFDFSLIGRRARDLKRGANGRAGARNWRPEFFRGDGEAVTADSLSRYKRRQEKYGWVDLRAGNADTASELRTLVETLEREVPDFEVPASLSDHGNAGKTDGGVVIRRKLLAFYPPYRLYEIADHRHRRLRRGRFLFAPNGTGTAALPRLVPLDGTANPIHLINDGSVLSLSGDAIAEYVWFFCEHVAGDDGSPFTCIEATADLEWRPHGAEVRSELERTLFPLRMWPAQGPPIADLAELPPREAFQMALSRSQIPPGAWIVDGFTRYNASLFHSAYAVLPDGFMGMMNDDPVLNIVPARLHLLHIDHRFLFKQSIK